MITLTGIPAVVLDSAPSPPLLSHLVATDAPVVFNFERREGNIATAAEEAGMTRVTLEAGHQIVDGDIIGVYDAGLNTMITAEATEVSTNVFDTDIPWDARFATDLGYVLSYTQRQYYFVEVRIKLNGIYLPDTMRATTNQLGNVGVDVSPFLRSAVSIEKVGDYTEDSYVETNQSGEFEIEFRERYTGDENDWTDEGNTWYYVYAVRSREQGVNLYEYIAHGSVKGRFFNEFERPVWTVGTPMDIQFWWPPWYENLQAVIKQFNAANVQVDSDTLSLDNAAKGRLCSVKINMDSIMDQTRYFVVEINEL